jgi:hypothetical protein
VSASINLQLSDSNKDLVLCPCCEKLVAERPGTVWEPRGSGASVVESRYQATASEDMTLGTSVCVRVTVYCKVQSRVVYQRAEINPLTNPKPRLQPHSYTCHYYSSGS